MDCPGNVEGTLGSSLLPRNVVEVKKQKKRRDRVVVRDCVRLRHSRVRILSDFLVEGRFSLLGVQLSFFFNCRLKRTWSFVKPEWDFTFYRLQSLGRLCSIKQRWA